MRIFLRGAFHVRYLLRTPRGSLGIERQGQDANGPFFICFHGSGVGGGSPEQLSPLIKILSPLACRFALPKYRMTQPEPLEAMIERGQLA